MNVPLQILSHSTNQKPANKFVELVESEQESQNELSLNFNHIQVASNPKTPQKISLLSYFDDSQRKMISIALGCLLLGDLFFASINKKCPYTNAKTCFTEYIPSKITTSFIPMLLVSIILILASIYLLTHNEKIPRPLALILIPNFIILFHNWALTQFDYHFVFNSVALLLILLAITTYGLVKGVKWLLQYRNRFCMIGTLSLGVIFIFAFGVHIMTSCHGWMNGLEESIDNSDEYCRIVEPRVCVFELTQGIFDLTRFQTPCEKDWGSFEIIKKYMPIDGKYIVFPPTQDFDDNERRVDYFQEAVFKRLFTVQDLSQNLSQNENHEFFLNITDTSKPEMIVSVQKNETLSQQRKNISKQSSIDQMIAENMLVIYIDTLSRQEIQRKMPKTAEWFKKFAQKQDNSASHYEFFRYHSIAPFTTYVMHNVYYGYKPKAEFGPNDTIPNDQDHKNHSFIQNFKDNGFVTARSADYPETSPLYTTNDSLRQVYEDKWDHEGTSYTADPNYINPDWPTGPFQGSFSSCRRCLYGKDVNEYTFEYGRQFWKAYPENRKLLYLDFLDAHEGTMAIPQYLDEPLAKYLEEFESQGGLQNTAVLLFADHGQHMAGIFSTIGGDQYKIERSLPVMYFLLPKGTNERVTQAMKKNTQELVDARDIYSTLVAFAEGQQSSYFEKSFFGEGLEKGRDCNDIPIIKGSATCACKRY